jgi:hypothetical protein
MREDFMNTNKKLKFFTLSLLFLSAFSLHCKKAKELIEVTEKNNKQHKNTVVAQANAQQKSTPSKTSECIKIPVVVAQNDPKKTSEKSDPSIKVTHLDAKKEEKKSPRMIDVCNGITKNMITYHYLGERVPTQFSVSFNNHPVIKLQDEKICTLDTSSIVMNQDDTLQVTFSYQFDVKGIVYHKGTKEITYKVPANLKEITPTFDWKKPEKVIIAQAELVTFRDI